MPAVDPRTHALTDALAFPLRVGALDGTGGLRLGWALSYLTQSTAGAMVLDALSGKLGASASDYMIKGTIFNPAVVVLATALGVGFGAAGTFFGAVVSATSALPAPPATASLPQIETWCRAVGSAGSTAAAAMITATAACTLFALPATVAAWTSTIWKVQ